MKRMRLSFPAVLLSIALTTGCGGEKVATTDPAMTTAATATDSTMPANAPASYDLQFLDTMSKHHLAAIAMAKMAQGKIEHPLLKELIARIPVDQQKEIDQMTIWRDLWYPGAPTAENMDMPGMKSSMNMDMTHMSTMKAGKDYDLMFIDMMTPHHDGAIEMSREAMTRSEHQEVKTLAQAIIDAQQREVDQMKQWKGMLTGK